jgi:hypothetical protein
MHQPIKLKSHGHDYTVGVLSVTAITHNPEDAGWGVYTEQGQVALIPYHKVDIVIFGPPQGQTQHPTGEPGSAKENDITKTEKQHG